MFRGAGAEFSISMVIVREAWALSHPPLNGLQAKRKHAELCLVLDNGVDKFCRYLVYPGSESVNQRGVTKDIDRARNPSAGIGNDLARVRRKQLGVRSYSSQTKVDVFADFISIHGPEV